MVYRVQFCKSPDDPLGPFHEVEAADPMDAIRQAWKPATIGPLGLQLWARVVLGTLPNGNLQVMRVPLVGAELPVDWTPGE